MSTEAGGCFHNGYGYGSTTNYSTASKLLLSENSENERQYGIQLSGLLDEPIESNRLTEYWEVAGEVLRDSLQEIRFLRAQTSRKKDIPTNQKERLRMILDCFVLLDKLSKSLPRAEEFSSSWLSSSGDGEGSSSPDTPFILDQDLWNELLKEWMMAWKEEQQGPSKRKQLPSPSRMSERVDRYRSRYLVYPNPTSYNILLNAMIYSEGQVTRQRIKAIKLADDYLHRLLFAQRKSSFNFVDTISVTTVMKGWIILGQPHKAQYWLELMENSESEILPNAIAYSILIQAWAKRGEPLEAESILNRALDFALLYMEHPIQSIHNDADTDNESYFPLVDRVVFHTVLDAWAMKARRATNTNNKADESDRVQPSLRSKALVQKMNDLADQHPLWFGENVRPNDETWHKLIAVVASTPTPRRSRASNTDEVGPDAAERLLSDFEDTQKQKQQEYAFKTPTVLLNRILQAYCSCGRRMEDAEAFFYRRAKMDEGDSQKQNSARFPNEVTFNIILSGWANAARVVEKMKKNHSSDSLEVPLRAEAWLETMKEYNFQPNTRAYSSVLQVLSLSTRLHDDAANRAEDLLRTHVWPILTQGNENVDSEVAKGVVICTNIVLRAWSNQIATGSGETSVANSLRLLSDFLSLLEDATTEGIELKPTEETFRAVLHAIATPSKSMTPVQKFDHAKALVACMKERFRLQPSKGDLAKFERIKKRKDAFLAKTKGTK